MAEDVKISADSADEVIEISPDKDFVTKQRALAFVRGFCMIVSFVAAMYGKQVDPDSLFSVLSTIVAFACLCWGYWQNNNWTSLANMAEALFQALKKSVDGQEK